MITSALAVAVASPVTHEAAPLDWPDPQLSYLLTGFALLLSPLALGVGLAFNRIMARARPATDDEVMAADTGDRRRRAVGRHLFGVVA